MKPRVLVALPLPDDLFAQVAAACEPVVAPSGFFPAPAELAALIPGVDGVPDFYRMTASKSGVLMMDASTGSEWNFQGCAVSGKSKGVCLERIPMLKDYWFDWRNYNPKTTIWGQR